MGNSVISSSSRFSSLLKSDLKCIFDRQIAAAGGTCDNWISNEVSRYYMYIYSHAVGGGVTGGGGVGGLTERQMKK